jgi:branched-chain amino acid transport system substrate-binding protein
MRIGVQHTAGPKIACLRRRLIPLALALAAAGCGGGGSEDDGARVPGRTLTVYSSLPRHGVSAEEAEAVAAGQRLALADADGRAASYRVRLVELDSADPDDDVWDPDLVERNADRAAEDETTIAYLGELDFGGSAISLPVTSREGILQISPGDGLTSLTRPQPGERAGPERYYAEGRRTFLRLVPNDLLQAEALVAWAREGGAGTVAVLHDDHLYGRGLAAQVAAVATREGVGINSVEEVRPSAGGYADVARDLLEEAPDAVVYTGYAAGVARPLLSALGEALPGTDLFASSGVAGAPLGAGTPVRVLSTLRPVETYPPGGRRLLRRLERQGAGTGRVAGLYGYEAMRVALEAIAAAGDEGGDRRVVVREALTPRPRRSVIGAYSIERTGDLSERRFAAYRAMSGGLRFAGLRDPDGPARP